MTVTTTEAPSLEQRRAKLEAQLNELRSQHLDIAADVQAVDADWQAALAAGEETGLLAERRRLRQGELDDAARSIQQVTAWLGEVDAELQRRQPHEALDRDLKRHVADLAEFEELRGQLDGLHQGCVDAVVAAALKLHDVLGQVRQRHAQLDQQGRELRARAGHLDRVDLTVPGVADWEHPLIEQLRGTALWPLYLSSVQRHQPADLAGALGNMASRVIATSR